ncbi:MAG: hypothetical protein OEZ22_09825 [Spirochaetia bacterium]|nr:hypothetical protein [Spirochaetia bacterium]
MYEQKTYSRLQLFFKLLEKVIIQTEAILFIVAANPAICALFTEPVFFDRPFLYFFTSTVTIENWEQYWYY